MIDNQDISRLTGTVVVMAKRPAPGIVKTRLTSELSPIQAAGVHAAMLQCALSRVQAHLPGRCVLALDDPTGNTLEHSDPNLNVQIPPGWEILSQGQGDLGDRLDHVWRTIGEGQAVFFGVDSPDTPLDSLKGIWRALINADTTLGPVDDGGYWCLASRKYAPSLLSGIDWGTSDVYHQTTRAAEAAGLTLQSLPPWHDVDTPDDLSALMNRLCDADEPQLIRLLHRLRQTTQDRTR